jgi:type I restriction enzyme S subunit
MNVGFGAFCGLLRPEKSLHAPYFGFFFSSDDYRKAVSSMARGVNINNLKREHFESLELPLPPVAEQKRIAEKLKAVLGRVDGCRARLDRVPELLKRFRQSVLAAATSGQLTEDLREEEYERPRVPLQQAITAIRTGPFGSSLHKADYVSGGVPIVNPMHINRGRISPTAGMTVDAATLKRLSEFRLRAGDVIIGRRGEMGRCAVVTETENGWLCGTGSMVLTPSSQLDPEYLQIFLSSPETVQALEGESVGSTMVNLNQKILLDLEIFFPPLPEQREIVRRVEALFGLADRIEARLTEARAQAERLTPATLAKAFRGELVPQDPNDEPASVLLQRLLTAKEIEATRPKHERAPHKRIMKLSTKESVRDAILSMKKNKFSFPELREAVEGDYDAITEAVFRLLGEEKPILKQVFDTKAKSMQFQRSKA